MPERVKGLLDSRVFAVVSTVQPDGSPQQSVVWVTRDGDDLLFSTTQDRRKALNMARDPRVTVLVNPADNPYTYAELRGEVTLTTDGGQELIDELSRKYTGKDYGQFNPDADKDSTRVVVRLSPRKIVGNL
ncbi:PPOX class F420-dependent oxidoreductase [Streptomyces sp. NBC_01216]|uniref:PPOX class F420-dependent oxidoreductase n=1 Tax=unclassified Streptomyces TaxID=2593676 RepID=UPI002E13DE85|nr:PPOX class F420-dependent oxidoreductase [Streptomyces sp. NBC_01216]